MSIPNCTRCKIPFSSSLNSLAPLRRREKPPLRNGSLRATAQRRKGEEKKWGDWELSEGGSRSRGFVPGFLPRRNMWMHLPVDDG